MTYALAWPLQEALYQRIAADPACTQHFGARIYDAPLPFGVEDEPDGVYLILGDEEVSDWSTATDEGAVHVLTLAIHAPRRGFADAKRAAADVSDLLLGAEWTLSRGRVVNVRFVSARTRREDASSLRRIEMRLRFVLEDTV